MTPPFMTLTKEQLAARLDGREMGDEITGEEMQAAKAAGLVVVFGHSDDCVEFRGAIRDEGYPNEESDVWLDRKGLKKIDEDDQEVLERHGVLNAFMRGAVAVSANHGTNPSGFDWEITTKIPHATFDIMEDGEKFCRGIVFSINDLPEL